MTVRGYLLGVDWFAVGDPAGTGEDDTSDVLSGDIPVTWGRETTQAGSMAPTGKMSFALNNDARRYSIDNVTSPLFGLVLPGRRVQLQHTLAGSTVKLFDGVLDEGTADTTAKTFTADCSDAWGRPSAEKLSTAVYRGLRTGDAVNVVLDAIGWNGARRIDPGATVMPWWWEEDTDAATAIEKLVDSEGPPALAYVQGGTFVFEDRFHRLLSPASQTSQGLFTHVIPAGSGPAGDFKILRDSFTYDNGLRGIVNSVTFTVNERDPGNPAEVWSTDTPFTVAAGASATLFATTSDPFINAVTPLQGADITVDSGTVTATLSRTSGASTIITVTASADAVISRLGLTATLVPVGRSYKVAAEDTVSVNTHGRATWSKDATWANRYDAQALADRIVATYARPRPVVTFDIAGLDATYMAQIRARQVSDRITVRNDENGLNADFMIEQLTHTIRNLGRAGSQDHRLTIVAEVPPPDQPINVFTFDQVGRGFNDGLFGLSGIDNADSLFMFDSPVKVREADLFQRTTSNGFGTSDDGFVWTTSGGSASDYFISPSANAFIKQTSVSVSRFATLNDIDLVNSDTYLTSRPASGSTTGASIRTDVLARFIDPNNWYGFGTQYEVAAASITGSIIKCVGGTITSLGSATVSGSGGYTSGIQWTCRAYICGSTLMVKIWRADTAEPAGFLLTVTDTDIPGPGSPGIRTFSNAGNTDVNYLIDYNALLPGQGVTAYPYPGGLWVTTHFHGFNEGQFGT